MRWILIACLVHCIDADDLQIALHLIRSGETVNMTAHQLILLTQKLYGSEISREKVVDRDILVVHLAHLRFKFD